MGATIGKKTAVLIPIGKNVATEDTLLKDNTPTIRTKQNPAHTHSNEHTQKKRDSKNCCTYTYVQIKVKQSY